MVFIFLNFTRVLSFYCKDNSRHRSALHWKKSTHFNSSKARKEDGRKKYPNYSELCVDECSLCSSGDDPNDKGRWKRDDHQLAVPPSDVDSLLYPSPVDFSLDHEDVYYKDSEESIYYNLQDFDTRASGPESAETIYSVVNESSNEIAAVMVSAESPNERRQAMNLLSAIYATLLAYVRVAEVFDWKTFESPSLVDNEIKVNNVSHNKKLKEDLDGTKKRVGRTVAMDDASKVTVDMHATPPGPLMSTIFRAIASEARKEPYEENIYRVMSANAEPAGKTTLEVNGSLSYKESLDALDPTLPSISTVPTLTRLHEGQDIGSVHGTVSKTSESVSELVPHTSVSTPPDPDNTKKVVTKTFNKDSTDTVLPSSSMQHTTSKTTLTENLQSLSSSTSLSSSVYMCSSVPKQNAPPLPLVSLLKVKYQKNPNFACSDTSQLDSPNQSDSQKPTTPTASQPQSSKDKTKQRGSKPVLMDLLKPKAHYRGPYKGPSTQKFRPFFIRDWSKAAKSAFASGKKDATSSLKDGAPVPIPSSAKRVDEKPSVVSEDQNPSNHYRSTDQPNRKEFVTHPEKLNPEEDSDINSADLTPGKDKSTSASDIINAIDSTNNGKDVDANIIQSAENDETGSDEKNDAKDTKNESWVQNMLGLVFG
ncbi:uncharacterized protein LOC143023907 isoform X2 [Oratosquilla oratoria]|uniref:uncharacterized protein LOC143023907 isoform X2 n=1 Tax=Oratosquilla oratoria TaxID=337810 RepID=UPI003F76FF1C